MNGNGNVASFLLHLGSDPDRCDSSGNSVPHYAAGYGWLHCLKLLKESGADLGKANDWVVSSLIIILTFNCELAVSKKLVMLHVFRWLSLLVGSLIYVPWCLLDLHT